MKGLTLIEPWATLIAQGRKQFETRSGKLPIVEPSPFTRG